MRVSRVRKTIGAAYLKYIQRSALARHNVFVYGKLEVTARNTRAPDRRLYACRVPENPEKSIRQENFTMFWMKSTIP